MRRSNLFLIIIFACGLCFLGGYRLHVLADGAPENPSLLYSGTLEQDGKLVNGTFTVTLSLYGAASGGVQLCSVASQAAVENGRFRIDATGCDEAIRDNANTWAEVSFKGDDGVERKIDGRSKIGAVPYAIESDRAIHADGASGELATQLQAMTERISALEAGSAKAGAFQAVKTTPQTIPVGAAYVVFDDERYDLADEYNPSNGLFTASTDGIYYFTCLVAWHSADGVVAQWEASLHFNGQEIYYTGDISDGRAATRLVSGTMKLSAGDHVQCSALQLSPDPQPLQVQWASTLFEGHRIAK